ncbi:hypothetical protein POKO110462_22585 [Pontibacter korlensis]
MLPDQVGQGHLLAVVAALAEGLGAAGQHPIKGHGVLDGLPAAGMTYAALKGELRQVLLGDRLQQLAHTHPVVFEYAHHLYLLACKDKKQEKQRDQESEKTAPMKEWSEFLPTTPGDKPAFSAFMSSYLSFLQVHCLQHHPAFPYPAVHLILAVSLASVLA